MRSYSHPVYQKPFASPYKVQNIPSHTLLLVNNEPHILSALHRTLQPDGYRLLFASSVTEALETLKSEPVSLILIDQRMAKMSGVDPFEQACQLQPHTIRVILTDHAEPQAVIDAVNRGEVYWFITKPWDDTELRLILHQALLHFQLMQENQKLVSELKVKNKELEELNQDLEKRIAERTAEVEAQRDIAKPLNKRIDEHLIEVIRLFTDLLDLRDPYTSGHSKRVAVMAKAVAEMFQLSPQAVREIEIAALMHDIGKVGIPGCVLEKPERFWTETERQAMQKHPLIGQALISSIENLKPIGVLIRHHHECFDGAGYPDRLAGNDIPLGARIIAVVDAYDYLMIPRHGSPKTNPASAVSELVLAKYARFDPEVINCFLNYLQVQSSNQPNMGESRVAVEELIPGMVLSRDLYNARGIMLMVSDTPLTPSKIERINEFNRIEQVLSIYVYSTTSPKAIQ